MKKKALIAMSGGVDSSVAAYLMKEEGFECIGATMHLYDNEDIGESGEKTCCSLSDVEDARAVANSLDMPFYVFNFKDEFKEKVIKHFVCEYECGRTPNPCIDCNKHLKFGRFSERARELGCDVVVTGHYAQIVFDEDRKRYLLKKGLDPTKDQSYVLYSMNQEELARTRFPLGGMTKDETRRVADKLAFVNAKKHDSQDICFVPDGDYASVIKKVSGKSFEPGEFIGPDGEVLGTHKGIINYTKGQRRGLGLALKEPLYVNRIDVDENKVYLSKNEALFTDELVADNVNWIMYSEKELPKEFRCQAKIRYSQKASWATVYPIDESRIKVKFDEPVRSITKGQAIVMYDDDIVVGGGTIC